MTENGRQFTGSYEIVFRGRGGAAEGATLRIYADGSDLELVTAASRLSCHALPVEKAVKPLFRQAHPVWQAGDGSLCQHVI